MKKFIRCDQLNQLINICTMQKLHERCMYEQSKWPPQFRSSTWYQSHHGLQLGDHQSHHNCDFCNLNICRRKQFKTPTVNNKSTWQDCSHTVGVEHLRDEAHRRRLVRVFLRELHRQLERPVFKRRLVRSAADSRQPFNTKYYVTN